MQNRLLKEGEKIQTGDKFYDYHPDGGKWTDVPGPSLGVKFEPHYLPICRQITEDDEKLKQVIEILEQIARLGNGDKYGNSTGNSLALDALKLLKNE